MATWNRQNFTEFFLKNVQAPVWTYWKYKIMKLAQSDKSFKKDNISPNVPEAK